MQQLNRLMNGEQLGQTEMGSLFEHLVAGELTAAQIAALLVALKVRGETPAEIAGAAAALRSAAKPFPTLPTPVADTCGTGGDGANTINISTAAALVLASMGVPVAKHGNRSVSSRSGSADVLESLGVPLDLTPEENRQQLQAHGFCFLFAPHYHPGFRYAMPVRQELKTRTVFNLLGPLINPARPQVQLLGVYDPILVKPLADTLALLGCPRAMVVHGSGLDELALHGPTRVAEVEHGEVGEYELTPTDFGLASASVSALAGGDAHHNARLLQQVLSGQGSSAQRSAIAMNVAAVSWLYGQHPDLKTATAATLEHLHSGAAARHLISLTSGAT